MSRLSTFLSFHNIKNVTASVIGTTDAPLRLEFDGGDWTRGAAEITLFLDDPVLSRRLADAINEIVTARKAERAGILEAAE